MTFSDCKCFGSLCCFVSCCLLFVPTQCVAEAAHSCGFHAGRREGRLRAQVVIVVRAGSATETCLSAGVRLKCRACRFICGRPSFCVPCHSWCLIAVLLLDFMVSPFASPAFCPCFNCPVFTKPCCAQVRVVDDPRHGQGRHLGHGTTSQQHDAPAQALPTNGSSICDLQGRHLPG